VAEPPDGACVTAPESQYRGAENQLYRVEIQRGGGAWNGTTEKDKPAGNATDAATFKWSRDNASVAFPIVTLVEDVVTLANLGRDGRRSLKRGDWVEIMDDDLALQGQVGPLRQIKDIKTDEGIATLSASVIQSYDESSATHPLLRRWDHSSSDGEPAENALLLKEGVGEDDGDWIALEDGVQIQFPKPEAGLSNIYRAGDYWLVPARVAIGDIWWPKDDNKRAKPLPPHGVQHHYAPLAVITLDGNGKITPALDLRRTFVPSVP
jgi:hypothetical protein